jgi:hypothetical protein
MFKRMIRFAVLLTLCLAANAAQFDTPFPPPPPQPQPPTVTQVI